MKKQEIIYKMEELASKLEEMGLSPKIFFHSTAKLEFLNKAYKLIETNPQMTAKEYLIEMKEELLEQMDEKEYLEELEMAEESNSLREKKVKKLHICYSRI